MSLEEILRHGILVHIELSGEERFYLPPMGPEQRSWPLLGQPWRAALGRLRFRARMILEALGIPGVFPGIPGVWVPPSALPALEAGLIRMERELERELAALRARMRERHPDLRREAMEVAERVARARSRRHPIWSRDRAAAIDWHVRMVDQLFPTPEELREIPRLRVIRLPVPAEAEWLTRANPEAIRAWIEGIFQHVSWQIYPFLNASRPLHPRMKGSLLQQLDRIPEELLGLFEDLPRQARQLRELLYGFPARPRARRRVSPGFSPNGKAEFFLEIAERFLVRTPLSPRSFRS